MAKKEPKPENMDQSYPGMPDPFADIERENDRKSKEKTGIFERLIKYFGIRETWQWIQNPSAYWRKINDPLEQATNQNQNPPTKKPRILTRLYNALVKPIQKIFDTKDIQEEYINNKPIGQLRRAAQDMTDKLARVEQQREEKKGLEALKDLQHKMKIYDQKKMYNGNANPSKNHHDVKNEILAEMAQQEEPQIQNELEHQTSARKRAITWFTKKPYTDQSHTSVSTNYQVLNSKSQSNSRQ